MVSAAIFKRALAPNLPPATPMDPPDVGGMDPSSLLMDEYARMAGQINDNPKPRFTPEEVAQRRDQNTSLQELGLLGSLSNAQNVQNTGGSVFKQALADAHPTHSDLGTYDPITQEFTEHPQVQQERLDQRRSRILDAAVRFQDARTRGMEALMRGRETNLTKELVAAIRAESQNNRSRLMIAMDPDTGMNFWFNPYTGENMGYVSTTPGQGPVRPGVGASPVPDGGGPGPGPAGPGGPPPGPAPAGGAVPPSAPRPGAGTSVAPPMPGGPGMGGPQGPVQGAPGPVPSGPQGAPGMTGPGPIGISHKPFQMAAVDQNAIAKITSQRASLQSAMDAVKANPEAFKFQYGAVDALPGQTLPRAIGAMRDRGLNSDQLQARALVFNDISAIIKERAGTAQSTSELKTLNKFLPSEFDSADVIQSKLQGFQRYLDSQHQAVLDRYPRGARGLPTMPTGPQSQPAPVQQPSAPQQGLSPEEQAELDALRARFKK